MEIRSACCINCGKEGYKAQECREKVCCSACTERSLLTNHRVGSREYPSSPPADIGVAQALTFKRAAVAVSVIETDTVKTPVIRKKTEEKTASDSVDDSAGKAERLQSMEEKSREMSAI